MTTFNDVYGYEEIKEQLMRIIDIIGNREKYRAVGARMPRGILFQGNPGVGKTLMSNAFITESGLPSFTIRRDKTNGEFLKHISETFEKAKTAAPSIVLLDDLDKYANVEGVNVDAEEYVAVQAGIDECAGSDVFVLATTNDILKLPDSLCRSGRFDDIIYISHPNEDAAQKIISHYIEGKPISENIRLEDLVKITCNKSSADIEKYMNEAAVLALYDRNEKIEMKHMIEVITGKRPLDKTAWTHYDRNAYSETTLHEAGHLVVSEAIKKGTVGCAVIRGKTNAYVCRCVPFSEDSHYIITSLAGKVAAELYFGGESACGCASDLQKAHNRIRGCIVENGNAGMSYLGWLNDGISERLESSLEAITSAEMERYMNITRKVLLDNRSFLEKVWHELEEKEYLLFSDIQRIEEECDVVSAEVR